MDALDIRAISSTADSVRSRLRTALHGMQAEFGGDGRSYKGLDSSVIVTYGLECFMRALQSTERGKCFVLKGGNLFRVWDGGSAFRPTGDLDMQCTDNAADFDDVLNLKDEVTAIVCTAAFRAETGLVFDMDEFKLEPIRKGWLVAYRLEGRAWLGPPGVDGVTASEVPFCLEVTYGVPPEGAVETQVWKPLISKANTFEISASRPEWMASEKFHSVATRGMNNGRFKDFRDLAILLNAEQFDDQLLHRCISQVFKELRQEDSIPHSSDGLMALTSAFASSHNEGLWQLRRWREWEGRDFDSAFDPTLRETVATVLVGLERKGVLAQPEAGRAAAALADMVRTSSDIIRAGVTPVLAGRFASALKILALSGAGASATAWRWAGQARAAGLPGVSAPEAFDRAMLVAFDLGMMGAIDRGWDRGKGGGIAAIAAIRSAISEGEASLVIRGPAPKAPASAVVPLSATADVSSPAQGAKVDKKRGRRADVPDIQESMLSGVMLLSQGEPGSHAWFGGLAKILSSAGAQPPADLEGINLDIPMDGRAPAVWSRISRKSGLPTVLDEAIAEARCLLGLDGPRLGMGR